MNNPFSTCQSAGIIVEIGGNHEGDLNYAFKLIDKALEAGAKSIKFQSYTGNSLVNQEIDPDRAKHFDRFSISYELQKEIAKYVIEKGGNFMSSLWDLESLEALNPFINIHKVGSGDLTNLFLISEICKTKKPLILSTAMSDLKLINETVDFIKTKFPFYSKPNKLALLHCVAMYGDLNDIHANLLAIKDIKLEFPDLVIGYSDHTLGVVAPILSLALGAEVVEVHFTDDKTRAFRDHHLSLDPNELTLLIESFKRHKNILGAQKKSIVEDVESPERIAEFRRSCYLNRDLKKGDVISQLDLITLRPKLGIDAKDYFKLIGKKLKKDKKKFCPLDWQDFE